jgi:ATP/maltotriose-dependent transcriptional regulator MalT
LHARHLALAATHGDQKTLDSLDAAAEIARIRGAPATAAELLDLAAELGGDTPQRRILSARHHFNAGDAARARMLLEKCFATPGPIAAEALTLFGVMQILEGNLVDAADGLRTALEKVGEDALARVQILVPLSLALYNVGRPDEAADCIEQAVAIVTPPEQQHLQGQALSMQVLLRHWLGHGVDEVSLQRALELEDGDTVTSIVTRPSMHNAMLLSFTGSLDEAHDAMRSISDRCRDTGDESELVFVAFHRVLLEIWRGELAEAAAIADDAMARAHLLDGKLPRGVALTMHAAVAAYEGRVEEARREANQARDVLESAGSILNSWPSIVLGFVEVSLSRHEAALAELQPLLSRMHPEATEIFVAAFIPDVVEALVALDRLDQAEPLVAALQSNGRRLDRAWMLAVGARGRAMMMAADGDIDGALQSVTAAMVHHDSLPMPFERARTQLLLGQLCRRKRQKEMATTVLRQAMAAFKATGATLWCERARAELARADVAHAGTDELTPSEQRVAELAAGGMTNRDIAGALFISPKTVETNLSRVYRKLGIHSRNQLNRHIGPAAP